MLLGCLYLGIMEIAPFLGIGRPPDPKMAPGDERELPFVRTTTPSFLASRYVTGVSCCSQGKAAVTTPSLKPTVKGGEASCFAPLPRCRAADDVYAA